MTKYQIVRRAVASLGVSALCVSSVLAETQPTSNWALDPALAEHSIAAWQVRELDGSGQRELYVSSQGILRFLVEGQAERFTSKVKAVATSDTEGGACMLELRVDDEIKFRSRNLVVGDPAIELDVPIEGAHRVELVVRRIIGNSDVEVIWENPQIQYKENYQETLRAEKIAGELESVEMAAKLISGVVPELDFSAEINEFKQLASSGDVEKVAARASQLRRKILFNHPSMAFDDLLFNKRQPPLFYHNSDQYLAKHSRVSPGLVVMKNWKQGNEPLQYLTKDKLPQGSILHPSLSFDGEKVIFSFADHTEPEASHRRFFIYEAAVDGSWLRQVTGTSADPMEREGGRYTVLIEDHDPCYLPDGNIVFSSTRSQNVARCHAGRNSPASYLYKTNPEGSKISPFSFGEANEIDPAVLNDGRVIFNRWEYINRHDTNFHALWTARPDGTKTANFYGNLTAMPMSIAEPSAIPGSHKVMATATAHHSFTAGSIVLIDPRVGDEGPEPITRLTPEVLFPEGDGRISQPSTYATPFPLAEDIFLAAYSRDQHANQGDHGWRPVPDNAYGIYLVYHVDGKAYREQIYRDPEMSCFTPLPLREREFVREIASSLPENSQTGKGTMMIQNVYQSTADIKQGEIKHIRVNQLFNQPAPTVPHRSWVMQEVPKRVIGTAEVADDGSVAFEAPAGVPLQLQLLDENKMSVMNMRSFIFLHDGETMSCVGCHEPRNAAPQLSRMSMNAPVQTLQASESSEYENGFSYVRSVQPVLDQHCISCHGLDKDLAGGVNLLGTYFDKKVDRYPKNVRTIRVSNSYDYLITNNKYFRMLDRNQEPSFSEVKDFLSHASQLPELLMNDHYGVKLSAEEALPVIEWLDTNGQFYGDYSWVREEDRGIDSAGEAALRKRIAERFGAGIANEPYAALVNNAAPEKSRILMAPLARGAGGWGQLPNGWKDTLDPNYIEMKNLVLASIEPLEHNDPFNPPAHLKVGGSRTDWVYEVEKKWREKVNSAN